MTNIQRNEDNLIAKLFTDKWTMIFNKTTGDITLDGTIPVFEFVEANNILANYILDICDLQIKKKREEFIKDFKERLNK